MSGCNDDEERVATQRTKVAQPIPLITYDDRVALDCPISRAIFWRKPQDPPGG
jgi:hypothetical protein